MDKKALGGMDDKTKKTLGVVGLLGVAALAVLYLTKAKGEEPPPPLEDDLSIAPPGFDQTYWTEAFLTCPGCSLEDLKIRYYQVVADDQDNPLTPAQEAELAALAAAILAQTTAVDILYAQWAYLLKLSSFYPGDTAKAQAAEAKRLEYLAEVARLQAIIDAYVADWTGHLDEWTAAAQVLAQNVGSRQSCTGAWAPWCAAKAAADAAVDYYNSRFNSTEGQARVCTEVNQAGTCVGVPWGEYDDLPSKLGINNNSIECMMIQDGVILECFWNNYFSGGTLTFTATGTQVTVHLSGGGPYAIEDYVIASAGQWFNLPSEWRNDIGSIKCIRNLGEYEADANSKVAIANNYWNAIVNLEVQADALARDVNILRGVIQGFSWMGAIQQSLINRTDLLLNSIYSIKQTS